ncbi:hypothetical protein [Paenibacillus sp. FSL E2-0151]|uniref:hypothetical protein n=1 Tax=Paenibacillus sp. FSL E2-0151 TaxID=2921357 RepID=UPI0030EE9AA5
MSKQVVFNASKEFISAAADGMNKEDRLTVIAPLAGNASVHAPSRSGKHKGYHRIKCEIWIPEDAIKGEDALTDFGAFMVLSLPKNRVQPHMGGEGADTE